ncbi:MAG: UDP-N-acetylmuramoyl-L-alanyl-D-glutamate--2,6-diaminopimelate ligase [Bacillaceae bacterium]|nr:UDP-N-acetylmuramoyl-L-alanyl-D-glutamate--2,6-diaminopimelate ligase [Bacillaceae bacterium]
MQLKQLIESVLIRELNRPIPADLEIKGVEVDSRQVGEGDLFICLPGFTVDGHDFARDAVDKGAVALLVERFLDLDPEVVQIRVPDTRRTMAVLADLFYGQPTHHLKLIGVTGTNGKTTTTHLIEKILQDAGYQTGLIGTMYMKINGRQEEVKNTTPDVVELQRAFKRMVDGGTDYAVMEVSSHALELGRVRGCDFHAALFTNLTQDHLDFHGTMDKYRYAKSLLFSQMGNRYDRDDMKHATLNVDDPASLEYAVATSAQVITYGIDRPADVRAVEIEMSGKGTRFVLDTFKGSRKVSLQLIGKFSVYNALAATAVCLAEGIDLDTIVHSLEEVKGVSGRFEKVDEGQGFSVIVDYAHTPDSLENVLQTVRELTDGHVYCVVGCGGDRDRAKRPLMAQIAARYSDRVVITSDNPRSEDPEAIIQDMVQGLVENRVSEEAYQTIVDRRKAIFKAVEQAKPGDIVLIAGKGHETYQIIKDQVLPFDDREVAREAIWSIESK